jgi:predicted transcriptional regulator
MDTLGIVLAVLAALYIGFRFGSASAKIEAATVDPNAIIVDRVVEWLATLDTEQYVGARAMFAHLAVMRHDDIDERVDKVRAKKRWGWPW